MQKTDWPMVVNTLLEMSKQLSKKTGEKRWTITSLAVEAGVSPSTMSRIVTDNIEPKHGSGEAILAVFKKIKRQYGLKIANTGANNDQRA